MKYIPLALTKPVSITYLTPGIVMDVSAMFVAKTIFLTSPWVGSNAFFCKADGKPAYNGQISTFESKNTKIVVNMVENFQFSYSIGQISILCTSFSR